MTNTEPACAQGGRERRSSTCVTQSKASKKTQVMLVKLVGCKPPESEEEGGEAGAQRDDL